ncbi:hypothetical protein ONZ45_g14462 [Pleurotus djamor]|nr:hypothetical protein ONZ45_g14462 [Pleurotus djamor]
MLQSKRSGIVATTHYHVFVLKIIFLPKVLGIGLSSNNHNPRRLLASFTSLILRLIFFFSVNASSNMHTNSSKSTHYHLFHVIP